jgi:hypothetical protein
LPLTSGFVAACPNLTELTIICPNPYTPEAMGTKYLLDPIRNVRSAMSGLMNVCKALPDFDTLQIVHGFGRLHNDTDLSIRQRQQALREHAGCVKELAINCLEERETGWREREGRRKTTVRVVELTTSGPHPKFHLDCVRVEECEV